MERQNLNDDLFVNSKLNDTFDCFVKYHKHFDVLTTRFSSLTYKENNLYREGIMKEKSMTNICIYGTKSRISYEIHGDNKLLFVLEMNNTINKIMGIGIVKTVLDKNQDRKVYSDERLNKCIYSSVYFVPLLRQVHDEKSYYLDDGKFKKWSYDYVEDIHPDFIAYVQDVLEPMCFKGKSHLKRGESFTRFPMKFMDTHMFVMLLSLFIHCNPNKFNENIMLKKFNVKI